MSDRLKIIRKHLKDRPGAARDCNLAKYVPFLLSEIERVTAERDELYGINTRTEMRASLEHQVEQERERDRLRQALEVARNALQLVSSPKRDDGTYNRNREACERLAAEALSEIARIECGKE